MFVIELIYKADLEEIDAHMAAHVRFLKKYYASGHFLVSGRKIPRDGGIILAVGESREELIIDRDRLMAALARVPKGQRAVLVLRYWEDLSIEQTAQALGTTPSNVRSQASRGLNTLRAALDADPMTTAEEAL